MVFARAYHEPEESPHLVDANAALDLIERHVQVVLNAGGEHALRERLNRILAPRSPSLSSPRGAARQRRRAA